MQSQVLLCCILSLPGALGAVVFTCAHMSAPRKLKGLLLYSLSCPASFFLYPTAVTVQGVIAGSSTSPKLTLLLIPQRKHHILPFACPLPLCSPPPLSYFKTTNTQEACLKGQPFGRSLETRPQSPLQQNWDLPFRAEERYSHRGSAVASQPRALFLLCREERYWLSPISGSGGQGQPRCMEGDSGSV